ncbi:MAG: hypothetical protein ABI591_03270 [Kofleriaceae bacterium]
MRCCALALLLVACGSSSDQCSEDLTTDHANCGTCGHACAADEVCSASTCGTSCAANQLECAGTCSDVTTDAMNCGACGTACDAGDVCVDSTCQVPCDATMLTSAIGDPWGVQWDGLDRTALAYDAAKAACQAFGARLPTATEMYRVSATQSGAVGQPFNTSYLWTAVPIDKLDQATERLSDGGTSTAAAATATGFRCVCPAVLPNTFTGKHCNGDPGSECFSLGSENYDAKDRPALRRSSAEWECTNDRAHLAEASTLIEGIRNGLPGSGKPIATADSATYSTAIAISWTATTADPGANDTNIALTTAAPFRCAAPSAVLSPNPATIPNQFAGPLSPNKGETMDSAAATWTAAHDACVVRGGHLPRAAELAELIQQGLPNGSNVALWTADQTGYEPTAMLFYAEVLNWAALDPRFSFQYAGTQPSATWLAKQSTAAFRCIYYPIDAAYVAPATCTGGCFMTSVGNGTMWFDSTDRAAASESVAIADCASSGGHLASERDLTEAIRAGLPNGTSPAFVLTSDFAGVVEATVVRWPGVQTAYTDQYSANMSWAAPTTARGYRCMWTNEQR